MKKYLILLIALTACTDATKEKILSFNDSAEIKCYSGGTLIYQGESTGKVNNESQSDGYYFKDKATGELIETNADCVIRRTVK